MVGKRNPESSARRRRSPKSVIRDALAWARGELSELPEDIEAGRLIERFGVQAVYGRPLGYGEMRRISIAESIARDYQNRSNYRDKNGAENWSEWATRFSEANARLIAAEIIDSGES